MEKINGNDNGDFNDNGKDCTERKGRVMFMGSSEMVLGLIRERAAKDYPNIEIVTYSPPYKAVFTEEDNRAIIEAINKADPDLLWIGMTAPKQEKWTYEHWNELKIHCHVGTIGAVFDFMPVLSKGLLFGGKSMDWNGCFVYLRSHAGCGDGISSVIRSFYGIF